MTPEELEFLISQYADGTISPEDRPAIEAHLDADPDARLLVHEYRKLNTLLTSAPPVPTFDFDALTSRINAAIDDSNTASSHRFRFGWNWASIGAGLAVAASIAIAVGLWLRPTPGPSAVPTVATIAKPTVIQVAILQPEDTRLDIGPALQQIQVGPPAVQTHSRVISEAIVTRPNTLFIAKADVPAQDTSRIPY